MGYKKMNQGLGFADLALASSLKHNRSLKTMEKLDKAINWSKVKEILMNHYTVGTSSEGADAYPPLISLNSAASLRTSLMIPGMGSGASCPPYPITFRIMVGVRGSSLKSYETAVAFIVP